MANKYNLQFIETSAKNSKGIDEVFYTMSRLIKEKVEQEAQQMNLTKTITLSSTQFAEKEGTKNFIKED